MGKSILAVVMGVLANFLIAVPIDIGLHAAGIYPPMDQPLSDPLCALALSYRLAAAVVGGYLTARMAPRNPMKHAWALGIVGVVLSAAGAAAMWGKGPHWYPLSLVVISIPLSLLGAKLV
ncbi:MAG TPA: hypothetical protein VL588_09680 [Bdellovibrionota bacterium]|jgi:hypothetical protein|nr:hypothetical protein [Bdellovibrionota bacterium]